jgi:hypothetical protein
VARSSNLISPWRGVGAAAVVAADLESTGEATRGSISMSKRMDSALTSAGLLAVFIRGARLLSCGSGRCSRLRRCQRIDQPPSARKTRLNPGSWAAGERLMDATRAGSECVGAIYGRRRDGGRGWARAGREGVLDGGIRAGHGNSLRRAAKRRTPRIQAGGRTRPVTRCHPSSGLRTPSPGFCITCV